jgi:flagellar biosynthetic protein FlhB
MADGSANEGASPRRRQQARADGQVVRSRELIFAVVFASALGLAASSGPWAWHTAKRWLHQSLEGSAGRDIPQPELLRQLVENSLLHLSLATLPLLAVVCLTTVLAHWIQHGPLWLPDRVSLDFSKMNPATNLERFGQASVFASLALGAIKLVTLSAVAIALSRGQYEVILSLAYVSLPEMVSRGGSLLLRFGCWIGLGLVVNASLDYAWQHWRHENALKMTPEQRRDEIRAVRNDVAEMRRRK